MQLVHDIMHTSKGESTHITRDGISSVVELGALTCCGGAKAERQHGDPYQSRAEEAQGGGVKAEAVEGVFTSRR